MVTITGNKNSRCGSPTKVFKFVRKAMLFGALAGMAQPELLAFPAIFIMLLPLAFLYAAGCAYHQALFCIMKRRQAEVRREGEPEEQSVEDEGYDSPEEGETDTDCVEQINETGVFKCYFAWHKFYYLWKPTLRIRSNTLVDFIKEVEKCSLRTDRIFVRVRDWHRRKHGPFGYDVAEEDLPSLPFWKEFARDVVQHRRFVRDQVDDGYDFDFDPREFNDIELQSVDDVLDVTTAGLKSFEKSLWNLKLIAAFALASKFLTSRSQFVKFGSVMGLWQLYTDEPPSDQLEKFVRCNINLVTSAIAYLHNLLERLMTKEVKEEIELQSEEEPEPTVEETPQWKEEFEKLWPEGAEVAGLETHRGILSIAALAIGFIGVTLAPGVIWLLSEKVTFGSALVELGKNITAKNIVWTEVKKTKDNLMWLLWKCCGKTYIPDEDKEAQAIQQSLMNHMKDLAAYEKLLASDFFGAMRSNRLEVISKGIEKTESLLGQLAAVKRSQYNLTTILTNIKTGYEDLLEKRLNLITNAIGKQEPVVIHVCGPPGHGKSEFMKNFLIKRLEEKYAISAYFRNAHDEYWSRFAGQQILVWDDIGFKKDGADYAEFCYHTSGAPSSAIGAAIKEKGRPTNPLFIIVTSNEMYLGTQGHDLTTPDAFHRRRDVVISFFNKTAADHLDRTGDTIPPSAYNPNDTKLTVYRPVPRQGREDLNALGSTTEEKLWNFIVEKEKMYSNHFKRMLRTKPYYKGSIPEDQEVNERVATLEYLTSQDEGEMVDVTIRQSNEMLAVGAIEALRSSTEEVAQVEELVQLMRDFEGRTTLSEEEAKRVWSTIETHDISTPELNTILKEKEANSIVEQSVNPDQKSINQKKPCILISGPSGVGKTHMANVFCQRVSEFPLERVQATDLEKDTDYTGKVVFVDDITMSKEDYLKAIKYANFYYDLELPRPPSALIFTQNDQKLKHVADASMTTEIRRRSHCVDISFYWTWMQLFWNPTQFAIRYKEKIRAAEAKAKCMNENLYAYFTPYEGKKSSALASEITSLLVGAFEKVYGDEIQTSKLWTLPLPSEIDFTVNLKRTIKECAELKFGEVFGSIVTGKLYSINNISGRFTVTTAMSMVVDIFKQAPYRERESLDDFVISFNEAEISSVFRPPGTAIITTPEGNVGLVWQDKAIRMFKITNDPVVLAENKIDIHKYFDPQVDTIYKRLVARMCFDPETIKNQEEEIEKIQQDRFSKVSLVCKILQSALSVCMIVLQTAVPISMFKDMMTEMEDRNELTYLRKLHEKSRAVRAMKAGTPTKPASLRTAGGAIPIDELEELLSESSPRPEMKRQICLDNPEAALYFAHERTGGKHPLLWKMFKEYTYIPITPSLESIDVQRRKSPTGVYGNGQDGEVIKNRTEVAVEYRREEEDDDNIEIDDELAYTKKTTYADEREQKRQYETDMARLKELEERYALSEQYLNSRTIRWEDESAPEPKRMIKKKTTPESGPEPKKILKKKSTVESGPEPRTIVKKRTTPESGPEPKKAVFRKRISPESLQPRVDFTPSDSTIEEAVKKAKEMPGDVYLYGSPNGFSATTGPNPVIASRLTREYNGREVLWAVVVIDPSKAEEVVPCVEAEIDVEFGDILRIRRSLAKHTYWHYGIVGPAPAGGTEPHLYHVQSDRTEDGNISAHIAVDPIHALEDGWEPYDNPVYTKTGEMYVPVKDYDFLRDHAFTRFPYNVNNSNCETWALSMRYGSTVLDDAKLQKLPSYFVTLLEIASTFTNTKSRFQEIREIAEELNEQGCIDPGALAVARDAMPPNAVFIHSAKSGILLSRGIGVRGRYVLMNHHTKGEEFVISRWLNGKRMEARAERVWDDPAMDLTLLAIKDVQFPMFKDISSKFMTISDMKIALGEGTDSVAMLNVPMEGKNGFCMHSYTLRVKGQLNQLFTGNTLLDGRGLCYTTKMVGGEGGLAVTEKGDCGSAVLLLNNRINKKIVGIHRAGSETKMYVALVPQEKLLAALNEVEANTESFEEEDGIMDSQCAYIDEVTGFPLVGFSKYGCARTRGTKLRLSPIEIPSAPCDGEPAILGPEDARANGYEPALTTLANFPLDPISVDRKELRAVSDELVDYLSVKLRPLGVLTRTEAINGPSKNRYPMAGSLDRKTSPGFPHVFRDRTTTKQSYFKQMLEKDGTELWRVDMNSENGRRLDRDLSRMLGLAHAGKRPNVVFSYFPKDEVLAKRKIETPKTRGILASNVPYVIAYRQYFLSLHLRVQELFEELPIKIGIDPHVNWHELAQYHLAKGNLGFDADAKNWDASVPVEFMEECAYIANRLYKLLDPKWKEEDDVVRSALHACVEKPYILYNRKVIQTYGGQVSGQPGTAFDNSLINWLLVALIYIRVMKRHDRKKATFSHFMKDCALSVYGDDMLITMGPASAEHFTIVEYAKEAKKFGFTITTADKTSQATSTQMKLEEMTFLKRSFKKIERTYVGPIEFASIGKSLKWIKGSGCYYPRDGKSGILWKVSDDLGLIRDNFENQLVEASLHGEMIFNSIRLEMNRGLREHNMDPITTSFNGALAQAGALLIEAGSEPIAQCSESSDEAAQTSFC